VRRRRNCWSGSGAGRGPRSGRNNHVAGAGGRPGSGTRSGFGTGAGCDCGSGAGGRPGTGAGCWPGSGAGSGPGSGTGLIQYDHRTLLAGLGMVQIHHVPSVARMRMSHSGKREQDGSCGQKSETFDVHAFSPYWVGDSH